MIKLSFIEEVLSLRAIKKDCSKGCTYGYAVSSPEDLNCSGGILVTGIVPQQPIPEGCAVIGSNILISELGVEYIVVAPDIRTEDIIAEIQKTFAEHSKLQQQKFNILRAAIDTRSLNSLANIVAEYMDSTIMINSSDLTLLAYSGYEISDTIFKSIVNNEQRSVNNIYTYQSGQLMEKVLENDKPVLLNTGAAKDMPRITGKVVINGRPVMFCGAFQSGRTFDWTSIELIDCLCEALKVMVIPGAGDSWTDIEKELIITEILENHIYSQIRLKDRINASKWKPAKNFMIMFINGASEPDFFQNYKEYCRKLICDYSRNFCPVFYKNGLLVLLEYNNEENADHLKEKLSLFLDTTHLHGGLSNPFNDLLKLPQFLEQAMIAVHYGILIGEEKNLYLFDDYYIYFILDGASKSTNITDLCHRGLIKLREYDEEKNTELAETLYAYITSGFNISLAAKKLYIHRNTMTYRLEKINDICNINYFDGDEVYKLFTSYKIFELLDQYGKKK